MRKKFFDKSSLSWWLMYPLNKSKKVNLFFFLLHITINCPSLFLCKHKVLFLFFTKYQKKKTVRHAASSQLHPIRNPTTECVYAGIKFRSPFFLKKKKRERRIRYSRISSRVLSCSTRSKCRRPREVRWARLVPRRDRSPRWPCKEKKKMIVILYTYWEQAWSIKIISRFIE